MLGDIQRGDAYGLRVGLQPHLDFLATGIEVAAHVGHTGISPEDALYVSNRGALMLESIGAYVELQLYVRRVEPKGEIQ